MTTHKEALKLALKDLKWVDKWLCEKPMSECVTKLRKAIIAIKEALAHPEHQKYCQVCQGLGQVDTGINESPVTVCNACNGTGLKAQPELCKYGQEPKSCTSSPMDCQCALDATFAQPEQEPVAYIHRNEYNEYRLEPHDNFDIKSIPFNVDVSLFKSPQRTWVGLTIEEMHQLNDALNLNGRFPIIAAIEAKLKEKNT